MGQNPPEDDKNEPSLQLPSMRLRGFGRKKDTETAELPTTETPQAEPTEHADEEPTQPIPTSAAEPIAQPVAEAKRTEPEVVDEQTAHAQPEEDSGPGPQEAEKSPRSRPTLPPLRGQAAAIVTGLVVGIFGTLLFYVSLRGCESLNGTESCGGPGFFLLVAILVLMVLFGGVLLKAWQISDPRNTSFLAIGVLCVVVLVTLMAALFSVWMFLLVPLISAGAYSLSQWVTTRFVEPVERGPDHDVR
jgi:hypothetical protein